MSSTPPPPTEVLVEFLHSLIRLVREWDEGLIPVLRGSLLLYRWYGDRARPPADIDLECFDRPNLEREFDPDEPPYVPENGEFYGPVEGRFGLYGEYVSRVDLGKAMCRYAVRDSEYQGRRIVFRDDEAPPSDGRSLWVYGTPGKRYYALWEWRQVAASGRLQLDLATPGPYTPEEIGVSDQTFISPDHETFPAPAYSREAMLAAKVSWLMRSFTRSDDGVAWTGEPKDLFDAHLLAADTALRPEVFRRAMLAIGAGDALNWNSLDVLFDIRRVAVTDAIFGNWREFAHRHPGLARTGPAVLWAELADRLEPLLGDLYPAADMPLLTAINAEPGDTLVLQVYADWLDERDDPRGRVVRLIAEFLSADRGADLALRRRLAEALAGTSRPWLHQLFGTSARLHSFIEAVGSG
jgi:uncharacterized protein (TIGR02996 family)